MAPAILVPAYFGRPWFDLVVAALGVVLVWEWCRLCGGAEYRLTAWITSAALLAVLAADAADRAEPAVAAIGAAAVLVASRLGVEGRRDRAERAVASYPGWSVGGFLYIAATCLAILWIRADAEWGRESLFWLFAVVWASDTGAYLVGRTFGGPKLAPRISPNKTWSGFFGGAMLSGVVGGFAAGVAGLGLPGWVVFCSVLASVVSQLGDLFESWVKRVFMVKDSGTLIPGHGGLFDRVDGLMAAAIAVSAASLLSGRNVLAWF